MALLIIIVGGTIRIFDAGESCPDWPTCFGEVTFMVSEEEQGQWYEANPSEVDSRGADHRYSTFEIFLEWSHRLMVGIIAVPILANIYYCQKNKNNWGREVFLTSQISGALLLIQAVVGAVTVRFDNVDWSVALHLVLALLFTCSLIWQWLLMRRNEGDEILFHKVDENFLLNEGKRMGILAITILILLILGSWVASTAGGDYNQGCSVGLPEGWPKCNGDILPNMTGPGVLVQMVHRIGAALVGVILIMGSMRLKESSAEANAPDIYGKCLEFATGFWLLNIFVGGLYIVLADVDNFPEYLSLLHLVIGVLSFLAAAFAYMLAKLATPVGGGESE
jgi:heme A synthase